MYRGMPKFERRSRDPNHNPFWVNLSFGPHITVLNFISVFWTVFRCGDNDLLNEWKDGRHVGFLLKVVIAFFPCWEHCFSYLCQICKYIRLLVWFRFIDFRHGGRILYFFKYKISTSSTVQSCTLCCGHHTMQHVISRLLGVNTAQKTNVWN